MIGIPFSTTRNVTKPDNFENGFRHTLLIRNANPPGGWGVERDNDGGQKICHKSCYKQITRNGYINHPNIRRLPCLRIRIFSTESCLMIITVECQATTTTGLISHFKSPFQHFTRLNCWFFGSGLVIRWQCQSLLQRTLAPHFCLPAAGWLG